MDLAVFEDLRRRTIQFATDPTGFSNGKASWKATGYGLRATQDWREVHCTVQVPQLIILSIEVIDGGVHDSKPFR